MVTAKLYVQTKRMKYVITVSRLFVFTVILGTGSLFANELKLTLIGLGSADAMLIETPGGKKYMVDTGTASGCESRAIPLLKNKGITKLDGILLTHWHPDHFGGIPLILKECQVAQFINNEANLDHPDGEMKKAIADLKAKKVPAIIPKVGDIYDWGGVQAHVIHTYNGAFGNVNPNDYSTVIKLVYKSSSFLLTGDLMELGEKFLIDNNADLKADVLKCQHHGLNDNPSNIPFLRKVNPKIAIVAPGYMDAYMMERTRAFGVEFFRTDLDGHIEIVSDGQTLTVNTEKKTEVPKFYPVGLTVHLPNKDGLYEKRHAKTGKLERKVMIKNGMPDGEDLYYNIFSKGDPLRARLFWADGKLDGSTEYYSDSGQGKQVDARIEYKKGKREGMAQFFNQEGKLLAESMAKDDQLLYSKIYNDDGTLFREIHFKDGKMVEDESVAKSQVAASSK